MRMLEEEVDNRLSYKGGSSPNSLDLKDLIFNFEDLELQQCPEVLCEANI